MSAAPDPPGRLETLTVTREPDGWRVAVTTRDGRSALLWSPSAYATAEVVKDLLSLLHADTLDLDRTLTSIYVNRAAYGRCRILRAPAGWEAP